MTDNNINNSHATILQRLIKNSSEQKLIVALAYHLNKSTTTIYAWGRIVDDSNALGKLVLIGQLSSKVNEQDGAGMLGIVNSAREAVSSAMSKK
ncbi:MAG: hypothetical protein WC742_12715 [Gallionellaceae bacterium]